MSDDEDNCNVDGHPCTIIVFLIVTTTKGNPYAMDFPLCMGANNTKCGDNDVHDAT